MSGGDLRPQYGPLALLGDIKGDRWRRGACGGVSKAAQRAWLSPGPPPPDAQLGFHSSSAQAPSHLPVGERLPVAHLCCLAQALEEGQLRGSLREGPFITTS